MSKSADTQRAFFAELRDLLARYSAEIVVEEDPDGGDPYLAFSICLRDEQGELRLSTFSKTDMALGFFDSQLASMWLETGYPERLKEERK